LFNSHTDPTFDPIGAAETAAAMSAKLLFNTERAARLVAAEARSTDNLGLGDMLDTVIDQTWKKPVKKGYEGAVQNTINHVVLYQMMNLAADENASSQVRAVTNFKLEALREWMRNEAENRAKKEQRIASLLYGYRTLQQFKDKGEMFMPTEPLSPPPGSPIGNDNSTFLQCSF
jgi:hypothetical protein